MGLIDLIDEYNKIKETETKDENEIKSYKHPLFVSKDESKDIVKITCPYCIIDFLTTLKHYKEAEYLTCPICDKNINHRIDNDVPSTGN